jgi:CHRD domain
MKKTAWAVLALLPLVGCGSDSNTEQEEMFSARLDNQVVPIPPPSATFTGDAGFTFDGQVIAFSADLRGLSLARRSNRYLRLRVHSGVPGTNGPPLATTTLMEADIAATGDRFLWQGQLGAAELDTAASLQEVLTAMRQDRAYVQVTHWDIGPNGDFAVALARGQIRRRE